MAIDLILPMLGVLTTVIGLGAGYSLSGLGMTPSIKTFLQARKTRPPSPIRLVYSNYTDEWTPKLAPEIHGETVRPTTGGTKTELVYENVLVPNNDFTEFATRMAMKSGAMAPKKRFSLSRNKASQIPMPTLEQVIELATKTRPQTTDPILIVKIDNILKISDTEKIDNVDGKLTWKTNLNLDEFEKQFPSGTTPSNLGSYIRATVANKVKKSQFDPSQGFKVIIIGVAIFIGLVGVSLVIHGAVKL